MIENKFEENLTQNKGHCDLCRETFYNDNEIYIIIFDVPKSVLAKITNPNEKIRLCRKDYSKIRNNIVENVFKK